MIWTAAYWKGAAERAVKTFFQVGVSVAVAGVGADAVGISAGLLDVSWSAVLSVSTLATVLSLATSLGNADFTAGGEQARTVTVLEPVSDDDLGV